MCGRYTMTSPDELLAEFGLGELPEGLFARYNIAPTQKAAVIVERAGRVAELMTWGLVPSWAKDRSIGNRLINARCETVTDKPAFRAAFKRRRCLVAADGFYEWKAGGKVKTPHHIRLLSGRPMGFAGLWESWAAPDGEPLHSFTIVTCEAVGVAAEIHRRMPVIVEPVHYQQWLASEPLPERDAEAILAPPPTERLVATAVSSLVNSPTHDSPECLRPIPVQQSLL